MTTTPSAAGGGGHIPMVVAAARRMNQLCSDATGVDAADCWAIHGEDFLTEAEDVLAACGALRLVDAARAYAMGYAQDEGAEGGAEDTGCSQKQHEDAKELIAAVKHCTGASQ